MKVIKNEGKVAEVNCVSTELDPAAVAASIAEASLSTEPAQANGPLRPRTLESTRSAEPSVAVELKIEVKALVLNPSAAL